jgi:hypothetical protein
MTVPGPVTDGHSRARVSPRPRRWAWSVAAFLAALLAILATGERPARADIYGVLDVCAPSVYMVLHPENAYGGLTITGLNGLAGYPYPTVEIDCAFQGGASTAAPPDSATTYHRASDLSASPAIVHPSSTPTRVRLTWVKLEPNCGWNGASVYCIDPQPDWGGRAAGSLMRFMYRYRSTAGGAFTGPFFMDLTTNPSMKMTMVAQCGTYPSPDATCDVDVTIPAGLSADIQILIPANYSGLQGMIPMLVSVPQKVTPVITWPTPAPIVYGFGLAGTELNATASYNGAPVAGTFVYTPPIGTVLPVGPNTLSTKFTPTDSTTYTTATKSVTIDILPATAALTVAAMPATIRFAGTNTGGVLSPMTGAQPVTVTFSAATTAAWTATADQPWVQITNGSGHGAGQFTFGIINPGNTLAGVTQGSATITVTAAEASNSPQTVAVELTLRQASANQPPIGLVDTPLQNATGQVGAIGVTGWAVDDVGIKSVTIYRNCLVFEPPPNCTAVNGETLVYVGDATLVSGARPDIEATYAAYPQANRAAWGYLLLTNMLPHVPSGQMFGGQGSLTLYVLAEDMEGHQRWLGRNFVTYPTETDQTPTTFTMANDTIAKPFGAIDTPTQGQTVSGSLWNAGWTLTPDSNTTAEAGDILMPLTGASQSAVIDGVIVGPLTAYNQCRGDVGFVVPAGVYCNDDVSNIFGNPTPQGPFTPRTANATKHRNLDAGRGPIGAYWLDTTTLTNGVHTIVWFAYDSAGRSEGIGSRYFTVLNGSADTVAARSDRSGGTSAAAARGVPATAVAAESAMRDAPALARGDARALAALAPVADGVWGRTGYDVRTPYAEVIADDEGVRRVQIRDLGRLELWLGAVERGYLVANGTLRDLPPGSRLDVATGVFTWAPGVGYFGTYRLAFVRGEAQILVDVIIGP